MSGALPRRFVENFNHFLTSNHKDARMMYSYHTHRDMLYSFAEFFHLKFSGPGVTHIEGVPQGFIPPSTSIFFELHSHDRVRNSREIQSEPYVSVFLYLPCNETTCPFTPIPIGNCGYECPFSNFSNIVTEREEQGDWMKLCSRVSRDTLHYRLSHHEYVAQMSLVMLITLVIFDVEIVRILSKFFVFFMTFYLIWFHSQPV